MSNTIVNRYDMIIESKSKGPSDWHNPLCKPCKKELLVIINDFVLQIIENPAFARCREDLNLYNEQEVGITFEKNCFIINANGIEVSYSNSDFDGIPAELIRRANNIFQKCRKAKHQHSSPPPIIPNRTVTKLETPPVQSQPSTPMKKKVTFAPTDNASKRPKPASKKPENPTPKISVIEQAETPPIKQGQLENSDRTKQQQEKLIQAAKGFSSSTTNMIDILRQATGEETSAAHAMSEEASSLNIDELLDELESQYPVPLVNDKIPDTAQEILHEVSILNAQLTDPNNTKEINKNYLNRLNLLASKGFAAKKEDLIPLLKTSVDSNRALLNTAAKKLITFQQQTGADVNASLQNIEEFLESLNLSQSPPVSPNVIHHSAPLDKGLKSAQQARVEASFHVNIGINLIQEIANLVQELPQDDLVIEVAENFLSIMNANKNLLMTRDRRLENDKFKATNMGDNQQCIEPKLADVQRKIRKRRPRNNTPEKNWITFDMEKQLAFLKKFNIELSKELKILKEGTKEEKQAALGKLPVILCSCKNPWWAVDILTFSYLLNEEIKDTQTYKLAQDPRNQNEIATLNAIQRAGKEILELETSLRNLLTALSFISRKKQY